MLSSELPRINCEKEGEREIDELFRRKKETERREGERIKREQRGEKEEREGREKGKKR